MGDVLKRTMGAEILINEAIEWPLFVFDLGYAGVCYSLDDVAQFDEPLSWEQMEVFDFDLRRVQLVEPQHPAASRPELGTVSEDAYPEQFRSLARQALYHHGPGSKRRIWRSDAPSDIDTSKFNLAELKELLVLHFPVRP